MTGTGSKYHKRFDPEFKREMVRLGEELGKSPSEVAREVGVSPATIPRWVKAFGVKGDAAFPGKGNRYPADEEIRRRKQRIKELEEENAIFKKATTIFATGGK